MTDETWMETELAQLRAQGLERQLQVMPDSRLWRDKSGVCRAFSAGVLMLGGRRILDFSSNDYLGLARAPAVVEAAAAALRRWGAGATSSRLLVGTLPCHAELETRLAQFKGYAAALVFGSGYLANIGTVSALVGRHDRVLADKLAHASLLDGATLSRAVIRRFQHNDVDHLRRLLRQKPGNGRDLIITESVFSMDGDLAPLSDIARVAQEHGAMLLVDEAHASGVWGPGGTGLIGEWRLQQAVAVAMGTLSKALGAYGGFIAGSETLKRWLVNRARSFIFSTGLPPPCAGAVLGALDVLEKNPGLGADLLRRADVFRKRLQVAGFNTGGSVSQIVPVIIGDNQKTLALARRLRSHGILAAAIRPPTGPAGTARLRLSVTLEHTGVDLDRAAEILTTTAREEGLL
ncbi:MAG: 8-amino-7-oxononanoate synthase [Kiritimatiellota bacterium]|nr:8-amino-7-oxononanoate synthase [Kiritimatiellota bacterium]